MPGVRRRRLLILLAILLGLAVFFVVSAILARVFSIDGAERGALTSLVQAEARGDANAMVRLMYHCDAACRTRASADAAALKRPGRVGIAEINPSAGFSLGTTEGTARVAWFATDPRPVVQCVRVRRAGNALSGFHVELLVLSRRIRSDKDCPKRY